MRVNAKPSRNAMSVKLNGRPRSAESEVSHQLPHCINIALYFDFVTENGTHVIFAQLSIYSTEPREAMTFPNVLWN